MKYLQYFPLFKSLAIHQNEGSLFSVVLGPSLCWRREPTPTELELWRHILFLFFESFQVPFSAFALHIQTQVHNDSKQGHVVLSEPTLRASSLKRTQLIGLFIKKCFVGNIMSVGFVSRLNDLLLQIA